MCSLFGNTSKVLRKGDPEPPKLAPGAARIYSMRFCPYAERVLLYAAAKNIPAEIVNVDIRGKPSWFLEKNDKGQVPTFEKDGKCVTESGIIAEYLDAIYPETSILPKDPYERAQQKILVDRLNVIIQALFGGLAPIIKGAAEGAAREEKLKGVENALDTAEKLLAKEFFGGSIPGYADWLYFPFFERLHAASHLVAPPSLSIDKTAFPGASRWPKLTAWYSRLLVHPAVRSLKRSRLSFLSIENTLLELPTGISDCKNCDQYCHESENKTCFFRRLWWICKKIFITPRVS